MSFLFLCQSLIWSALLILILVWNLLRTTSLETDLSGGAVSEQSAEILKAKIVMEKKMEMEMASRPMARLRPSGDKGSKGPSLGLF